MDSNLGVYQIYNLGRSKVNHPGTAYIFSTRNVHATHNAPVLCWFCVVVSFLFALYGFDGHQEEACQRNQITSIYVT